MGKMKRIVFIIFSLLLCNFVNAGDARPEYSQGGAAMTPHPTNSIELLRNLKYALDHDLYLKKDFYTEANLKNILGVGVVTINKRPDGGVGFGSASPGYPDYINGSWRTSGKGSFIDQIGANHAGGLQRNMQGNLQGGFNLGFATNSFPVEDVEEVFGKNWKHVMEVPNPHGGPMPATAARGSEHFYYEFNNASRASSVYVRTQPNGKVENILIIEEAR